eukprot:7196453-Alexandrium_andersonii.AAC.1
MKESPPKYHVPAFLVDFSRQVRSLAKWFGRQFPDLLKKVRAWGKNEFTVMSYVTHHWRREVIDRMVEAAGVENALGSARFTNP